MDDSALLQKLTSTSKDDVLDALAEIQRNRDTPPPAEVVERCLELISHPDSEIRHETVFAMGLHWGERRTLPALLAMLRGQEKEPDIQAIAARAVGSIFLQNGGLDPEALKVLARITLDEEANAEVRGIAYMSARTAAGLLTSQECARLPEDIRQLPVDWNWLKDINNREH